MSAINHRQFQRRTSAFLGIVALTLFQISIASHQFKHVADHGFTVCDICTAYNQLDDAPVADALHISFTSAAHVPSDTVARPFELALAFAPYLPRAPPHS